MALSPEKTSCGAAEITGSFDFLGINLSPGAIRPSLKAQNRFLASVDDLFENGRRSLNAIQNGATEKRPSNLLGTLKKLDGMIDGWGKHYWFCNDNQIWINIDAKINALLSRFLGYYVNSRERTTDARRMELLGISELTKVAREPFSYPRLRRGEPGRDTATQALELCQNSA